MDAKHENVDPSLVAQKQTHLTFSQQKSLGKLLASFKSLFNGKLGNYPHQKNQIELKEDA